VRLVADNFVPVALNLYKIRKAKGPAGDFFRSAQKQRSQYQGLWVVSPAGKVLAANQEMKHLADRAKWTKSVLADLQAGLKAFGAVKPRKARRSDPLPHRGVGARPGGGVTLAVTDRWVIVKSLDKGPPRDALGATIFDSINLTDKEWAHLAPAKAEAGSKWEVPKETARKFFPLLSPADTVFRDPKEVTAVQLAGRVRKVEGGVAYLSYEGRIAGTHHGTKDEGKAGKKCSADAKLIGGVGEYDVKAGKMISLTLVYDGQWRNYAPYDDPPTRFGAVVEWSRERPKP
jgi:hypothetical protein